MEESAGAATCKVKLTPDIACDFRIFFASSFLAPEILVMNGCSQQKAFTESIPDKTSVIVLILKSVKTACRDAESLERRASA